LRERYGEKVRTPLISAERGFFGRKIPGLGSLEVLAPKGGLAADLISALEERALWGRYGL
jgi:serine protease SohB